MNKKERKPIVIKKKEFTDWLTETDFIKRMLKHKIMIHHTAEELRPSAYIAFLIEVKGYSVEITNEELSINLDISEGNDAPEMQEVLAWMGTGTQIIYLQELAECQKAI